MNAPGANPVAGLRDMLQRLSPKQRQYAMLAAILLGGVGMLWLIFAFTDNGPKDKGAKVTTGAPSAVTNIGVMPPLSFGRLSVKAKTSHSMPTPVSRMAASIANWRCFGDRRCRASRSTVARVRTGAFIVQLPAG